MDSKNYTQVLIDGKIYTLGGSEDEGYLQRAASYVNEKVNTLRRIPGFTKQRTTTLRRWNTAGRWSISGTSWSVRLTA